MAISEHERRRLVDTNVEYVRSIAAKIKGELAREIEYDDLVAYGMQGLLEASERYDHRHGVSFSTFSYYRIRGAIFDGLRNMGWLPRHEYARYKFESRANHYLQNLADREAGTAPEEHPGAQNDVEHQVRDLAEALGGVAAVFVTSLDAESARAVAAPEPAAHVEMEARERDSSIRQAIESLPEKERALIELYYYQDLSLAEAGEKLGMSKSWTSRLHARAVTLIKAKLKRGDPDDG